ncbi:ionotropic receptor 21a-like [Penaeus chinensis]|uniref:ionotropic receptor 21a-like n=1 Tax=Penaeus chinensis TaxID=139456 RepID=UPI001FB8092C|nr:ionotropic receptor 21a-like [Penaeus chinensis]
MSTRRPCKQQRYINYISHADPARAPFVGEAVVDILSLKAPPACSTLLLSDGTSWAAVILQVALLMWLIRKQCVIFRCDEIWVDELAGFLSTWGVGIFRVADGERDANGTEDQLSQMVPLARQIRLSYRCTNVVVISRDLTFLYAFAKRSLQGRLLVWSTKLLLVTRQALQEVQKLLEAHWTFAMMNAAILNLWEDEGGARYDVYLHLPYGDGEKSRRVASWTAGRGVAAFAGRRLFPEKFLDFHGAEVGVTALPFLPFWDVSKEKGKGGAEEERYTGSDYMLLETLAGKMNFTIRVLPSSSWAEATRLVEERLAFCSSIYHIVFPDRQERYDFTYTYELAQLSFSLAKPFLRPRWQSLYYPLTDEVWAAILAAVVVVPLAAFVITRLWPVGEAEEESGARAWRTRLGRVAQDFIGMLLGQCPPQGLPRRTSTRVLVGTWLLFSLVVVAVYRGNLTASLMLPKYPPRPETLADLLTAVDAIAMPPYGEDHRRFFKASDSIIFNRAADLMVIGPSVMEGLTGATQRKQAVMSGRRHVQHTIAESFTDANGETRLYLGRDSVFPAPSGWPIPHDAPYKHVLDRNIMAVLEAGLYEKWVEIMIDRARRESKERQQRQRNQQEKQTEETAVAETNRNSEKPLTLVHLQGPLILLLLGLIFSTFTFTLEVIVVLWLSSRQG